MNGIQTDNRHEKYAGWLKERANQQYHKQKPYPNDPNEDEQRRIGDEDEVHIPKPVDPNKKKEKYGYGEDEDTRRKENLLVTIYGPILCAT